MNKKFIVPFETAKALKEKGYNGICDYYYEPDKELYLGVLVSNMDYEDCGNCSAPTYHEVVDWLEEKGFPIEISCIKEYADSKWMWLCCVAYAAVTKIYSTREEAINEAILRALETL